MTTAAYIVSHRMNNAVNIAAVARKTGGLFLQGHPDGRNPGNSLKRFSYVVGADRADHVIDG